VANTLTSVIPRLLAQGLMALRQQAIMPRLVNRGYETLAAQRGSTVDIPIPSAVSAVAVTPANTPPATADMSPTHVSIVMDQWYEAPFHLSDKDLLDVMDGVIPMQASEAIKALANNVDAAILAKYTGVYGYAGTAGTTPFGSGLSEYTAARTVLNKQLAPINDRRVVLNPDAEGNALLLRAFQDASFGGGTGVIMDGQIGRKVGADWWMDQLVPTHVAGTITTGLAAKAATAVAAGLKTFVATTAASTGAVALKVGDIINIAGHSQTYVITEDATEASANTDVSLKIEPGLQIALAGGEAVTVKGDHAVNMLFHRDAFALASRPLQDVQFADQLVAIESAVDPVSGLTLRLEITREHKRWRYSFDILYGCALVRPALATRIAG
jgi:hypothetical protein